MAVLVRLLNAMLMIALPVGLGLYLSRSLRPGWRPFLIGAATFLGSQVFHIPFNALVLSPLLARLRLSQPGEGWGLVLSAAALGLSAGVFEEGARFLVLKRWLQDARTWAEAVMFGAGHGGLEAAALGVVALVGLFQGLAYREADLSTLVAPDQLGAAQAQIRAYWAAPISLVMLGAVERAFALCVQVSLAVVVLQAIIRKNLAWLGLAIVWHALVDASAVAVVGVWGPYRTEAMLGVMAAVNLIALFKLRTPNPPIATEPPPSSAPPQAGPAGPPRRDSVEDSRFIDP